jgi:DNA-binding NarL/FixJ family response regulator
MAHQFSCGSLLHRNLFICRRGYCQTKLPANLPNVALMDINLPGMNGIEAVRKLKAQFPSIQFIMSTVYEDDESIFESLKAGASGYLLKKASYEKILDAIEEVHKGGSPMSGLIARRVIDEFRKENIHEEANVLTQREKEILNGLVNGLRYKEIASNLNISVETVRNHVRHIYEKLHVQSRMEAVKKVYGLK